MILYSALMTGIYMLTVLVRAYFPQELRSEAGAGTASSLDPGLRMLVPLVIFVLGILVIGLHSAPLMEFLNVIGGEAG